MGQNLACSCFDQLSLLEDDEQDNGIQKRLQDLVIGNKFFRSVYLGMTLQELTVQLSENFTAIKWKSQNTWTKQEYGEIDLTSEVKKLKPVGDMAIQFIGHDDSIVFEIKAEETAIRDRWIVDINELLQTWIEKPELKPNSTVNASGTSNKAEYFKKREEEIKAREKANAERKAKYSSGGMKLTAQIMADRA